MSTASDLKIICADPKEILTISAKFLMINEVYFNTKYSFFWLLMVVLSEVRLQHVSVCFWNSCTTYKCFCVVLWSPKAFCNIVNVSAQKYSFVNWNLMQVFDRTNSANAKIGKLESKLLINRRLQNVKDTSTNLREFNCFSNARLF